MNRLKFVCVVLLCIIGIWRFNAPVSGMAADKQPTPAQSSTEVTSNRTKIRLTVPLECAAGEACFAEVVVTNVSEKLIVYGTSGHDADWGLKVINDTLDYAGLPAKLTSYGRESLDGGAYGFLKLAPQESVVKKINMSRLFDFSLTADYKVKLSRTFNPFSKESFVVTTDYLTFKVSEPTDNRH